MKRLFLALAVLQAVLVVALAVRIVGVWTTPLPEFSEVPDLPAMTAIPASAKPSGWHGLPDKPGWRSGLQ